MDSRLKPKHIAKIIIIKLMIMTNGKMAKWKLTNGKMTMMTKWQNEKMTKWQNEKWQNDKIKIDKWKKDKMTKWQNIKMITKWWQNDDKMKKSQI